MKQLLVAFFMWSSVICLRAQDSITVIQRTWASGVCCSSGTTISLLIPRSIDELNIDSIEINIRGTQIHVSEELLRSSDKQCYVAFGWSSYNHKEGLPHFVYDGISEADFRYVGSYADSPAITLFLFDGTRRAIPVKFREEIIAYP